MALGSDPGAPACPWVLLEPVEVEVIMFLTGTSTRKGNFGDSQALHPPKALLSWKSILFGH